MPKDAAAAGEDGAGTGHGNGGVGTADGHTAEIGAASDRISGPAMSAPMNLPKDREAEARKEAGVGIGLADDLRSIRTALVKAKLAGDFEAAFDLMLFQMVRSVFTDGYRAHALDIAVRETADRPTMRMNDADFAAWSPGEAMLEDRSGLSFDWLAIEDDGESFAAMRELSQAEKQALFAACVARTCGRGRSEPDDTHRKHRPSAGRPHRSSSLRRPPSSNGGVRFPGADRPPEQADVDAHDEAPESERRNG